MGFFDIFRKKPRFLYQKNDLDAMEAYIEKTYGKIETVFHELKSPVIHLDIYVIAPTEEAPYYKFITVGMGAYPMHMPENMQGLGMDRAELVTFLPSDWNIKGTKDVDYWPIRMMKQLGRLPIRCKTWIGEGHSVAWEDGKPYAENTGLNSCFLLCAGANQGEPHGVLLPSGKKVRFFQIIPTYQEEMDFKLKNGTNALVQRMNEHNIGLVIDPKRENICK